MDCFLCVSVLGLRVRYIKGILITRTVRAQDNGEARSSRVWIDTSSLRHYA